MPDTLTDAQKHWTGRFTGLRIPSSGQNSAPGGSGGPNGAPGGAPHGPAPPPAGQQLHFKLSGDERTACDKYLSAHLGVSLPNGAPPAIAKSYVPALDGKEATIDAVIKQLLPLTLAGMSRDGSDQIHKDTGMALTELVTSRIDTLARAKSKASMDAAATRGLTAAVNATAEKDENAEAAKNEAEVWVKKYFEGNGLRTDPMSLGANDTVWFGGQSKPFASCVSMALGAAALANLKSGDQGRALITKALVTRIAKDMVAIAKPAAAPAADEKSKGKGGDDDGPEVSVEVNPTDGKADTQIQYTVKLRATNDASPPVVQYFPDVEVTFHTQGGGKSPSLEVQLNAIKADVGRMLHIPGKIKIEASVGLSAESNIADAAMGNIAKSVEVKLKAELSIGLTKHFEIKPSLEQGLDGKPKGGVGVVWKF